MHTREQKKRERETQEVSSLNDSGYIGTGGGAGVVQERKWMNCSLHLSQSFVSINLYTKEVCEIYNHLPPFQLPFICVSRVLLIRMCIRGLEKRI